MRITQWGEFGVLSCIFLANQHGAGNETVRAQEIAESNGIDLLYTQQILQRLRRGEVIGSVRGSTGGYQLAKPAAEITLGEILRASEGDTFEIICETKPIDSERCKENAHCSLRPIWYQLRTHIDQFLDGVTLEQLASNHNKEDAPIQISKDATTEKPHQRETIV